MNNIMYKEMRHYMAIIALLLLGSCAKETNALVTIDVNHPDQTVEMKVSDLISDPEYIPLETNDSWGSILRVSLHSAGNLFGGIASRSESFESALCAQWEDLCGRQ